MLPFNPSLFKKLFSVGKKILLVVTVYFIIASLFVYFINRDKPKLTYDPVKENRKQIYNLINDKGLSKTTEGKTTIAFYRLTMCGLIGEGCTNNPEDGNINFHKSAFGFVANLISFPIANPPASGLYWVMNGLQNAGFIPKTYAAEGIGFSSIRPLMTLWTIFRDIAYALLVVILIAIGFMIMFRMKINPQTVISIENALPRIVLALLLITFSFAIAGFLIDLMYIIIAISVSVLAGNSASPHYNVGEFQNKFLTATPATLLDSVAPFLSPIKDTLKNFGGPLGSALSQFGGIPLNFLDGFLGTVYVGSTLFGVLPSVIQGLVYFLAPILTFLISTTIIGKISEGGTGTIDMLNGVTILAEGWGRLPKGIAGIVIFVILCAVVGIIIIPLVIGLLILFTILFLFFRIFFLLLKTYLTIIFLIVISPIILLFVAVPGKNAFSFWFKHLFAEIMTFPIVVVVLLIGYVLTHSIPFLDMTGGTIMDLAGTKTFWVPPFLYGLNQYAYQFLIGLGVVLLIPEIIKLTKELIGVKDLPIGIGLGTFFGGVGAAWAGTQGGLGTFTSLTQMPGVGGFLYSNPTTRKLLDKVLPPQQGKIMADYIRELIRKGEWPK